MRPVMLGSYAAKTCAMRIVHEHDPANGDPEDWPPEPERSGADEMRAEEGNTFEAAVFDEIAVAYGRRCADLRPKSDLLAADREALTFDAMTAGTSVILAGRLPRDVQGGRVGEPDILVRVSGDSERPAYRAVDVKSHKVIDPGKSTSAILACSPVGDLAGYRQVSGASAVAGASGYSDGVQLAHYEKMLRAVGFAADGPALAGIVGSDPVGAIEPGSRVVAWYNLDAPTWRSGSSYMRSYENEFGFRLKAARVAQAGLGVAVTPVGKDECASCRWASVCWAGQDQLPPGEQSASYAITSGRPSEREWLDLRATGIETISELAGTDPQGHSARIRDAITRARMHRDGVELLRVSDGELVVPRADIEIDFDIEWDTSGFVYLWGASIRGERFGGGEPRRAVYKHFSAFDRMDADVEHQLAEQCAAWMRGIYRRADHEGLTVSVYHYTQPETSHFRRVLGDDACEDLFSRFVDLHRFVKDHFFGLHGLGLKKVAPALGFSWRDSDPGGAQSQVWYEQAIAGDADARKRVLQYNDDDCRATAAIRDGLSR